MLSLVLQKPCGANVGCKISCIAKWVALALILAMRCMTKHTCFVSSATLLRLHHTNSISASLDFLLLLRRLCDESSRGRNFNPIQNGFVRSRKKSHQFYCPRQSG